MSYRLCASLVTAAWLAGCSSSSEPQTGDDAPSGIERKTSALERASAPSAANVPALGRGNQAFAFELFRALCEHEQGKNVVFSPYSVSTALAMTYAGARGTTESEMRETLHFELEQVALHEAFNAVDLALTSRGRGKLGADGTPFRLNVNNAIWAQRDYPVVPTFLDTLALNYGAGVFLANFAAQPEPSRLAINAWVGDKTEQLIQELLPRGSITSDTRFVLTNTVYFNASWQTKFEKEATGDAPFTKLDGQTVQVPIMNAGYRLPYAKGDGYQAVALPYASEELAFIAVLPDSGSYQAVEQAATGSWFAALREQLAAAGVQLGLPKLDYETQASLKDLLQGLGMRAAFLGADFSGLTPDDVVIDDVIHDAVIKVIEGGTIAAAATAVTLKRLSAPLFDHTVRFDHPFFYAIVDQPTGEVLFLGRVLDPSAG